jgi:hypothetical protein
VVATAAQTAVTTPAVSLLLNAASKSAFAQVSPYAASQNHIRDDVTFGNGEEDIDAAVFGNANLVNGTGNQDDRL